MRIVRDPQTAEDLAQETYIRARRAFDAGHIEHPEGFLHQTARNLALDHLRRRGTRTTYELDGLEQAQVESVPADVVSIEDAIIERQKFILFKGALAGLPKRAQAVLILSRVEGWSQKRIAEHLQVTERTVFNDLKMAMAHCREALARYDGK